MPSACRSAFVSHVAHFLSSTRRVGIDSRERGLDCVCQAKRHQWHDVRKPRPLAQSGVLSAPGSTLLQLPFASLLTVPITCSALLLFCHVPLCTTQCQHRRAFACLSMIEPHCLFMSRNPDPPRYKQLPGQVNVEESKCSVHPSSGALSCPSPAPPVPPPPPPTPLLFEAMGSIDVGTLENSLFEWNGTLYLLENIGVKSAKQSPRIGCSTASS